MSVARKTKFFTFSVVRNLQLTKDLTMDKLISAQKSEKEVFQRVKLDKLPKFSDLKSQVDNIVNHSTWWDLYGVDWLIIAIFGALLVPSLIMLRSESWILIAIGTFMFGWIHNVFTVKSAHLAAHGGLSSDRRKSRPLSRFFIEFYGQFSEDLIYDFHIKQHHPYTNIIGIGDSSSFKAPFLPRFLYMFVAPWLIPAMSPIISVAGLVQKRALLQLMLYFAVSGAGLAAQIFLLMKVSKFSLGGAFLCLYIARGILSIPYLHVNIFQHIGLPMYSKKSMPVRLYQMSSCVLNLPSNPILSYAFGHSIMNCHVEHHLFPKLSDNMCLKIKPVVSKFLKENGLPYHEDTYMGRLKYFLDQYDTLMVNAPPITHFVGIQ